MVERCAGVSNPVRPSRSEAARNARRALRARRPLAPDEAPSRLVFVTTQVNQLDVQHLLSQRIDTAPQRAYGRSKLHPLTYEHHWRRGKAACQVLTNTHRVHDR